MKKDIEWLREEIYALYPSSYRAYVLKEPDMLLKTEIVDKIIELIDQLEEPTKPVIPKFVAEWFENNKRDMEIEDVFWQIENCEMVKLDVDRWISDNRNTFIRAWLDGYEVEKEQKYHVVNKENYFMLRKYDGLVDILHVSSSMSRDEYGKDTRFMLTEKEIKDYDERYWAFAEEVNPCN